MASIEGKSVSFAQANQCTQGSPTKSTGYRMPSVASHVATSALRPWASATVLTHQPVGEPLEGRPWVDPDERRAPSSGPFVGSAIRADAEGYFWRHAVIPSVADPPHAVCPDLQTAPMYEASVTDHCEEADDEEDAVGKA